MLQKQNLYLSYLFDMTISSYLDNITCTLFKAPILITLGTLSYWDIGDLKTPDVVRMRTPQTAKLDYNLHLRNFFLRVCNFPETGKQTQNVSTS